MIFLDTDILSYFFSSNALVRDKLRDAVDNGEQIAMTAINVYEVLKGLKHRNNLSLEKMFMNFLSNIPIFTLDDIAMETRQSPP